MNLERNLHQSIFTYSLKEATALAYLWSKRYNWYYTAVKSSPYNIYKPNECWLVTNKYDPRVTK